MFYFIKTPAILRRIYKSCTWRLRPATPTVYLTFDDGPHPKATPFILDQLKKYNAHATFFCIGKNVAEYPDIYERILVEGNRVGNHTHHHLNGWKTDTKTYVEDVLEARQYIDSDLFRPPYGKITPFQINRLKNMGAAGALSGKGFRIIMWDVLSGDFDPELSPGDCLQNVLFKTGSGAIIVFHDSEKAWERMSYVLPRALEHFTRQGYKMEALDL